MSEVSRNGKLVTDQAPTHVMFTSDARGDDFAYQCWNCTDQPVRQLHLMVMPPGHGWAVRSTLDGFRLGILRGRIPPRHLDR